MAPNTGTVESTRGCASSYISKPLTSRVHPAALIVATLVHMTGTSFTSRTSMVTVVSPMVFCGSSG